ncbi:NAD(P)-dependent oxidoreductase [Paenibacillus sp. NEAU-GSW1]|uniref:NAD(P)-dependent oxidoreductase n=1 Tax=Paenibacillus sp. NEAU-GSW1 TaxID=2682486 RepID=UPI0012E0D377|nr:NAD(P)-dependent oxidoreductase [Paenibacillus sp. NEAU-GSW1]MUT66919.1 NAD(P)H-binding protein [Paenibacillus sp. NEAU-GSW1]
MKIAVIGASGKAGSNIVKEALDRGHEVTAIVRDASKAAGSGAAVIEKDVFALTADDLNPFDAVVNAFAAPFGQEHLHVDAGNVLIQALEKGNGHPRLIVVGGAGSLYVDPDKTTRVIDTPGFPDFVKPTAANQGKNLEILRGSSIKWTFVSPSAEFALGKRTGSYMKGTEFLLVNSKGHSYVSYEDYAIAIVDEIENPQHLNERFTVASEKE